MRTKTELRKELKTRLASITDPQHHQLSLQVSVNLNDLLNRLGVIQKHLLIAAFAPFEKEPKWFLFLEKTYDDLVAFPAIQDDKMIYRHSRFDQLEVKKDFGASILGPRDLCPVIAPDIVLVPGLGFSERGERLGRGKGYYDKELKENSALKVGIAFEMQIEESLPVDPHDVLMDFIVTEKRIIKIES